MVVDSSLAFKWVVVEQDSEAALRFFVQNFGRMHAPDLLMVEIAGSLVRRANERRAGAEDMDAAIGEIRARVAEAIVLHRPTPELVSVAARMAMALGHPLKDCVYLALADELGCPLATCDVKFRDRVADPARVRLLAELV